jgi:hypothetical protein
MMLKDTDTDVTEDIMEDTTTEDIMKEDTIMEEDTTTEDITEDTTEKKSK